MWNEKNHTLNKICIAAIYNKSCWLHWNGKNTISLQECHGGTNIKKKTLLTKLFCRHLLNQDF